MKVTSSSGAAVYYLRPSPQTYAIRQCTAKPISGSILLRNKNVN